MKLYLKDFIKCSHKMFYNALHGIILFGWVFEDSSDLQNLAR